MALPGFPGTPFLVFSGVVKMCGNSSTISLACSTNLAPCLINVWVPVLLNELMLPGTANTSLFCSAARRAVMREPLRSVASTITVPRDMPEMTRLRMGK